MHGVTGHPDGVHVIELPLFQGGKEALHPGVALTASGAAHTLDQLMADKGRAEGLAGKLAAPVGVDNGALCWDATASLFQGPDAQFRAHTGDLGDICQELLIGFCRRKIPLDQLFRLLRLPVPFRQAVGAALTPDGQMVLPADTVDPPGAGSPPGLPQDAAGSGNAPAR